MTGGLLGLGGRANQELKTVLTRIRASRPVRYTSVELLVIATLGLLCGGVVSSVLAWGTPAGDAVVNLVGSLIGVAVTLGGAIYLTRRQNESTADAIVILTAWRWRRLADQAYEVRMTYSAYKNPEPATSHPEQMNPGEQLMREKEKYESFTPDWERDGRKMLLGVARTARDLHETLMLSMNYLGTAVDSTLLNALQDAHKASAALASIGDSANDRAYPRFDVDYMIQYPGDLMTHQIEKAALDEIMLGRLLRERFRGRPHLLRLAGEPMPELSDAMRTHHEDLEKSIDIVSNGFELKKDQDLNLTPSKRAGEYAFFRAIAHRRVKQRWWARTPSFELILRDLENGGCTFTMTDAIAYAEELTVHHADKDLPNTARKR